MPSGLLHVLQRLLTGPAEMATIDSPEAFDAGLAAALAEAESQLDDAGVREDAGPAPLPPIDAAILGGFVADRVGYAFAAGYAAALRALVGATAAHRVAALCVTERGGGHPRAIETTLARAEDGALRLDGAKRWATFAARADHVLVAARTGTDDAGRPRIVMVRVGATSPGVTVTPMPPPPFVPEIVHAELRFEGVAVDDSALLPGDGYERYIKPFRTVEDIHVHAALLGYLTRVARAQGWPRAFVEEALTAITALRGLALADASAPALHVALAGALAAGRRLVEAADTHWAEADVDGRARWTRDRPLLLVAGSARAKRIESAWTRLEPLPPSSAQGPWMKSDT